MHDLNNENINGFFMWLIVLYMMMRVFDEDVVWLETIIYRKYAKSKYE